MASEQEVRARQREAAEAWGPAVMLLTPTQYLEWERKALERFSAAFPPGAPDGEADAA